MVSINTALDIIERLMTIASLTNELKIAFYKKLFRKWIRTNQNLKGSLESLIQDVKENSNSDLSAEHILGCLEGIKSHAAEFRKRIGKEKKSDQLLKTKSDRSRSVNSICKSITEIINTCIIWIVMYTLADHFNVWADLLESSRDSCNQSNVVSQEVMAQNKEKFQQEYDQLVPIECINENQVLEL